jgi:hypothetical protein
MRRLVLIAIVILVAVVLGVAQLVLPGIAAQRLRDRLAASGTVTSVQVDAFPAIELLWHHADRVVVKLQRYRSNPGPLGGLLGQAGGVGSIDASVGELDSGLLTVRDATLRKRGNTLSGTARVTQADLRAAVPFLDAVQPVASGGGALLLRGTATLLGITASVDATVAARNGNLIVQPQLPLGGLATVTVFSNPALDVRSIAATGTSSGGFSVNVQGLLR